MFTSLLAEVEALCIPPGEFVFVSIGCFQKQGWGNGRQQSVVCNAVLTLNELLHTLPDWVRS